MLNMRICYLTNYNTQTKLDVLIIYIHLFAMELKIYKYIYTHASYHCYYSKKEKKKKL